MHKILNDESAGAFAELERGVHAVLETYSNVHRGSGHNSMVSTHLYEKAREVVLEYLGLNKDKNVVIFCSPRGADILKSQLRTERYYIVSSRDIGLPLGVRALVASRKTLPGGTPFHAGGGTTRLVSPGWIIWANPPDRFEAGTPPIVNVITFARALQLTGQSGKDVFRDPAVKKLTAKEILYHDELEGYSGQKLLDEIKKNLIGRGVLVPTAEGDRPFINLDNAASTPTFSPILNTFCRTWHQSGQVHQEIIREVRRICAEVLGAPQSEYDVVFTSNTTEAVNLAAESMSLESGQDSEPVVISTILEHTSNDLPWRMIPGVSLIRLKIDADGFVDLNELESLLTEYNRTGQHGKKRIRLVALTGASNVLGVFNNLPEISRIAHLYGARLFVDAAQMVAHRKIDMEHTGIDYLAFSAHKVYAPFGTGALVVRKGLLNFNPADLELIRASGEENAGGIAALGKALLLLQHIGFNLIQEEEQALTARALHKLSQIDGLTIYGIKDPASAAFSHKGGVIVFLMKGLLSPRVAKELAEQGGIGVRSGCHCAHILIKHLVGVPPSLERFQRIISALFPGLRFPGLVRVSLGIENSEKDIDTLIQILTAIARKSRSVKQSKLVQKKINDFVRTITLSIYS